MNGWFILFVAISISVVAAYYSIVGLAAIFAGAVIPVVIMASVLEVGKLVSAVWLHQNWKTAHALMKTYFTIAVVVLMFITSMGIFGFLSRAHIEHSGSSAQLIATIENLDIEITRAEQAIISKRQQIESTQTRDSSNFTTIQQQIDQEQANIDRIYARIQPDISRLETALQTATDRKRTIQETLSILESGDARQIQATVGVPVDGRIGPQTRLAIEETKTRLETELPPIEASIVELNQNIISLRATVAPQVEQSNQVIAQLRSRISFGETDQIDEVVSLLEDEIAQLELQSRTLSTEKFDLETKLRLYEVEVGPIKYIAEFVYGESSTDLIEKAVRGVILLIIFVFDPLAVLLVLAAVSQLEHRKKPEERSVSNLKKELDDISNEFFDGIHLNEVVDKPEEMVYNTIITEDVPNKTSTKQKPNSRNFRVFRKKLFG